MATPGQIAAAAERIAEPADLAEKALAEEDPCRSAVHWSDLPGETQDVDEPEHVFALPDYCDDDGTTSPATQSSRAPGGAGRPSPLRADHATRAATDRWREA